MDRQQQSKACCRVGSSGTGFLVAPDRVATCRHAVQGLALGAEVSLVFDDAVPVSGRLLAVNDADDGALLAIPPLPGRTPLLLADACDEQEAWEGCGYADGAEGNLVPLSGEVEMAEGPYAGRFINYWFRSDDGGSVRLDATTDDRGPLPSKFLIDHPGSAPDTEYWICEPFTGGTLDDAFLDALVTETGGRRTLVGI